MKEITARAIWFWNFTSSASTLEQSFCFSFFPPPLLFLLIHAAFFFLCVCVFEARWGLHRNLQDFFSLEIWNYGVASICCSAHPTAVAELFAPRIWVGNSSQIWIKHWEKELWAAQGTPGAEQGIFPAHIWNFVSPPKHLQHPSGGSESRYPALGGVHRAQPTSWF